jgi:glycerophosphoryl diester phosphodiesterase
VLAGPGFAFFSRRKLAKRIQRIIKDNFPVVYHDDPAGQPLDIAKIMRGQYKGIMSISITLLHLYTLKASAARTKRSVPGTAPKIKVNMDSYNMTCNHSFT